MNSTRPSRKTRPEEILQAAAQALKAQGPRMSLRAVARRLAISPSYWSKILRGERPLAQHLLPKVVKVLAMDTQQIAELQRAILEAIERDQLTPMTGISTAAQRTTSPVEHYSNLGQNEFWLLDEWFYIPILNLFTLREFEPTALEVSRRLGVALMQVIEAIRRLELGGFLEKNAGGHLQRTQLQARFPTDRSHPQVRKYHSTMILKGREQLLSQRAAETFDSRLISSVCFAGSADKLREARLIMEEAMYRAANLMANEAPGPDEVYQLNIQIFPLTK